MRKQVKQKNEDSKPSQGDKILWGFQGDVYDDVHYGTNRQQYRKYHPDPRYVHEKNIYLSRNWLINIGIEYS